MEDKDRIDIPKEIDAEIEAKPLSPFQRFRIASGAILKEGQHDDEEDTNQLNKKEDD